MSNFIEKLNFSEKADSDKAIEIKKGYNVRHCETLLCMYCTHNDIDLSEVTDEEIEGAAECMSQYGQLTKDPDSYFFWID